MIVSDIPGTTRDAIDTRLPWGRTEIVLIDTAGIRRRGRVAGGPAAERYSTLRSFRAISRADVAVLLIDAVDGLTAQDAHIAGFVVEEGAGSSSPSTSGTRSRRRRTARSTSTSSGSGTRRRSSTSRRSSASRRRPASASIACSQLAVDVWAERRKRVPTGELNRILADAAARQEPPAVKGKRPKLFYATQAGIAPPTFVFFAREAGSVHFSYRRYLENRLRDEFGFLGTPIRLVFRERATVRLPRRRGGKRAAERVPRRVPGPSKPAGARPTGTRRPGVTRGRGRDRSAGRAAASRRRRQRRLGHDARAPRRAQRAGPPPQPLPGVGRGDRDDAAQRAPPPGHRPARPHPADRGPGDPPGRRPTSSSSPCRRPTSARRSAASPRTSRRRRTCCRS